MSKYLIDEISLFLPAYNEEAVIAETVEKADKVLKKIAAKYEILVINDGSKDKTGQVVEKIAKTNKNVRLFTHSPNRGYGGALRSGFKETRYDPVVFTDSDGQFDFSEVTKLIEKMHQTDADMVIGYRIKRNDPQMRLVLAGLLKIWNLFWFGMWNRDTDCGFKLIRKHVFKGIGDLKTNGGIISTEFMAKVKQGGYHVEEVGVHHYARTAGKSTGDNVKVIGRAITETFHIWMDINTQRI
jgi:glycosyltransferase involved in cell wall biosynthesis